MATNHDPDQLRPIIHNRRAVQEIALDLFEMIEDKEEVIANDNAKRRMLMLAAGATFSLWRAVPLVYINRKPIDNVTATRSYLEQIVRHNAITYSDDTRTRVWTFGYYLSNARYRLREFCIEPMASSWPNGRRALEASGVLDKVIEPRDPIYNSAERVRLTIVALRALVDELRSQL